LDIDGHLSNESNRLAKIFSAQSQTTIDKDNEYLNKLNMCSDDDEKFIKYYLYSQKLIVQKAIENLK